MLKLFLYLAITFVSVNAAGELSILHSPDSTKFTGHESVDESTLKDVLSACMGFTITKGSDWSGLSLSNPFHFAEAAVVVVVDGILNLELKEGHRYPLITNEDEFTTWQALHNRVMRRYLGQNTTLLRMDLSEQTKPYQMFGGYEDGPTNWSVKHLDTTVTEDKQFLDEMATLRNIARLVQSGLVTRDGVPDIYWMVVRSLHPLVDLHGPDSAAAKEAKDVLRDVIHSIKKAFVYAYRNRVVVATLSSDVSHTRRTRSLMAEGDETEPDMNLAPEYSPEYPVIFNIMLWFSIAFFFSLLAISMFIADMDPGRDSIIYRMTSTRMKKDN